MTEVMNKLEQTFSELEFQNVVDWVMNFYPIEFFGYRVPLILLVAGIAIVTAIIGAAFKTLLKVTMVVFIIYLISMVIDKL